MNIIDEKEKNISFYFYFIIIIIFLIFWSHVEFGLPVLLFALQIQDITYLSLYVSLIKW